MLRLFIIIVVFLIIFSLIYRFLKEFLKFWKEELSNDNLFEMNESLKQR